MTGILHIARLGRPFFRLENRRATSALRLRSNAERVCETSVQEGIYAEAFPLFLNYYPSSQILRLPADGAVVMHPALNLQKLPQI